MNASWIKKALAIGLAASMVGGLAACGATSGETTPPAVEQPADKPTEGATEDQPFAGKKVRFSTYASSDTQLEYMKQFSTDPTREATGIDVETQIYADRNSLLIEVAGGAGPDILDLDGPTDVVEFINSGKAVELTTYAEKYGWNDLFMEWAYSACYYKDKLYSLPTTYEGMGIYYNTDVMKANNWEVPKTVEEMEALMPKIIEAGLVPISFGNSNYQGAVDWLYSTMLSCYGNPDELAKVLEGKDTLQGNAAVKESMQKMVDWWKKGFIDNNSQSITNDDMMARFASGDAVMMINGTWGSNGLTTDYPDCNWAFELMPAAKTGDDPIFPIAIGGCNVINANSTEQDAAAEVLNFIYSGNQENHYQSILISGAQPSPTTWFDPSKLVGLPEDLVHQYDVMDASLDKGNVGFCAWTFYPAQARVYMNENTDACFLGSLTVEEYLTNAQGFIDEAIKDGAAPQLPTLK